MGVMEDIPPLSPNPAALDFLLTRRSRPPRTLGGRAPTDTELRPILEAGLRVPDHGKLEPWRLIVLQRSALDRLSTLTKTRGMELGYDAAAIDKKASSFSETPLAIAVISSLKPSDRIPNSEQLASVAAVCLSITNAALASGWGACWLTGWMASDRPFLSEGLLLLPNETVAGFIHIGEEMKTPPERPRPSLDASVTWMSE